MSPPAIPTHERAEAERPSCPPWPPIISSHHGRYPCLPRCRWLMVVSGHKHKSRPPAILSVIPHIAVQHPVYPCILKPETNNQHFLESPGPTCAGWHEQPPPRHHPASVVRFLDVHMPSTEARSRKDTYLFELDRGLSVGAGWL